MKTSTKIQKEALEGQKEIPERGVDEAICELPTP